MNPWTRDWRAKVTSLLLAIVVWFAVKANQEHEADDHVHDNDHTHAEEVDEDK